MAGTTTRALTLLDLLQTRRRWSGAELCDRLEVTDRTLRRDIERLRDLGYEVSAARGANGGYRLEPGANLPPLLLTDDEAVTVALGLRTVATQGLVDGEHTTLTALAKLEQVLPAPLRRRVSALAEHVRPLSPGEATVAAELLGELALACRDGERVRFRYTAGDGARTDRLVEPASLVASRRAWFLVAFDRGRDDWRTFRVDRASTLRRVGVRDPRREVPGGDPAAFVARALRGDRAGQRAAEVVVDLPAAELRAQLRGWGSQVRADGDHRSVWPVGGASAGQVVAALAWLPPGVGYELRAAPDVLAGVAAAAERMATAARV